MPGDSYGKFDRGWAPDDSYAKFDRGWALGCASVGVILLVVLLLVYSNAPERVRLRFFPPGTSVPVSELERDGPLYRGYPLNVVAASTSLDSLRQTILGQRPCPGPPDLPQRACWGYVHVPSATLFVAVVADDGCGNREWDGWTRGSALTIQLVTWGCLPVRRAGVAAIGHAASYTLLGVPLSHVPHGRVRVSVADSGVPPVLVSVP